MSLYYEASTVLSNPENTGGSLKSRTYSKKDLRNSPTQIYALVSETTKWSPILKEVVEKSEVLKYEKKVWKDLLALISLVILLITVITAECDSGIATCS
jgi:putative methyltransferase